MGFLPIFLKLSDRIMNKLEGAGIRQKPGKLIYCHDLNQASELILQIESVNKYRISQTESGIVHYCAPSIKTRGFCGRI